MDRDLLLKDMAERPEAWVVIDSVFAGPSGEPLFSMPVLRGELADIGLRALHFRETRCGGFEFSTRAFVSAHLADGDLFIDVGAHWGLYSLTASFSGRDVDVLAVEPHPANAKAFMRWMAYNRPPRPVRLVQAAVADRPGRAPLFTNTTMGHRLPLAGESARPEGYGEPVAVPVATLDGLVADLKDTAFERVVLKVDVEGLEPAVFAGARDLLASGKMACVIWEKGREHARPDTHEAFMRALGYLGDLGFDSYRFPHEDGGGPLVPYVPSKELCNIVSVERGFPLRPNYPRPWGTPLAELHTVMRPPFSHEEYEDFTTRLIRAEATDAGRWAVWESMSQGTHLRAGLAARHIPPGSRVLDLGCGIQALKAYLPEDCAYTPCDLLARSRDCLEGDLNQGFFPDGEYDVVAALFTLEFIHDLPGLLKKCRASAPRLVLAYHPVELVPARDRRAQGFFNDLSAKQTAEIIQQAGYESIRMESAGRETWFICGPGREGEPEAA